MEYKIVLLCIFSVFTTVTAQLRCYACSFSSVDADQSCLTITNSTPSVDCRFTYCTIMRQEFVDPIGVVASFTRGCEESPDYLNHEVIDPTFKTYYRACTTDLCNIEYDTIHPKPYMQTKKDNLCQCLQGIYCKIGNGIQSIVGGSLLPTPEYTGLNLLVPGTGNGTSLQINILLYVIALTFYVINI